MNEQNGQVDIETVKAALQSQVAAFDPSYALMLKYEHARALLAHLERLEGDRRRLDWLSDPANYIGDVTLPREFVERNMHSLRAAIDDAMKFADALATPPVDAADTKEGEHG